MQDLGEVQRRCSGRELRLLLSRLSVLLLLLHRLLMLLLLMRGRKLLLTGVHRLIGIERRRRTLLRVMLTVASPVRPARHVWRVIAIRAGLTSVTRALMARSWRSMTCLM